MEGRNKDIYSSQKFIIKYLLLIQAKEDLEKNLEKRASILKTRSLGKEDPKK